MCVCARGVGCYSNLLVVETGLLLVFVAMAFATAPVAVLGGGGCLGAESVSAPRVCGCAGSVGCCSSLEIGLQFMYVLVMNVLLWCWCSSKRRWLCSAFVAVSAPKVCGCVGAEGVCWSWHRGMCDGARDVVSMWGQTYTPPHLKKLSGSQTTVPFSSSHLSRASVSAISEPGRHSSCSFPYPS